MPTGRNFKDPKYVRWRDAVMARDNYTCVLCGKQGGRLEAHHIKKWNDHPELRYNITNGVVLCQNPCHANKVTGNEEAYEELFKTHVAKQKRIKQHKNNLAKVSNNTRSKSKKYRPKNPYLR